MKIRSPYYEQSAIERKRKNNNSQIKITKVSQFHYQAPSGKCSFCGSVFGDFPAVFDALGTVKCHHNKCHLICQECLDKIGGVLQGKKIDMATLETDDCPCHRLVAEKLMGKKTEVI